LCREFNKETRDGKKMDHYSELLGEAIDSIINKKKESDIDSLFRSGGTTALENEITGLNDFELICFLVVKDVEPKAKKTFRLVVAGSRDFTDYEKLSSELDAYLHDKKATHEVTIISGSANGADKLGERYAREHGLKLDRYPAEWEHYGNAAGPIRNKKMAQTADAVIVFWDGTSAGTKDMIQNAKREGLPCTIINI
jgi:hypothetical protein